MDEPAGQLSDDQLAALAAFDRFMADRSARVFVLSGPAGTGKTSLLGQMIHRAEQARRAWRLAAITGRAAAIARSRTGRKASTAHAFLYRFDARSSKIVDGLPRLVFSLRDPAEDPTSVLFVDEASMIGAAAQGELETLQFGSGNMAADLLRYLFGSAREAGVTPKLVLVGDPYQLPPVSDAISVVFEATAWDELATDVVGSPLETVRVALATVHRQSRGGGILEMAGRYREALSAGDFRSTPRPPTDRGDVSVAGYGPDADKLARETAANPENAIVITHTNRAALSWSRRVREHRWGNSDEGLQTGELLLNTRRDPRTGYENGDQLLVVRMAGAPLTVSALGREVVLQPAVAKRLGDSEESTVLLMLNALESEERTVDRRDFQVLWVDFRQRNRGLRQSTPEFWEAAFGDPVLNPIVAKYGYAMTCHRAQGGQWNRVVVDFASVTMAPDSSEAFRWAYTAITRAQRQLVLVDPPYRSPFSRLATGSTVLRATPEQHLPEARELRERAEQAISAWARDAGLSVQQRRRSDYHTRFLVETADTNALFDVFFKAGGRMSHILPVSSTGDAAALIPPIHLIQRVVFADLPRPADPRVVGALTRLEDAFRGNGLQTFYRGQHDWKFELEITDGVESGILSIYFRQTGVLSGSSWVRKPSDELQRRVGATLQELAGG